MDALALQLWLFFCLQLGTRRFFRDWFCLLQTEVGSNLLRWILHVSIRELFLYHFLFFAFTKQGVTANVSILFLFSLRRNGDPAGNMKEAFPFERLTTTERMVRRGILNYTIFLYLPKIQSAPWAQTTGFFGEAIYIKNKQLLQGLTVAGALTTERL